MAHSIEFLKKACEVGATHYRPDYAKHFFFMVDEIEDVYITVEWDGVWRKTVLKPSHNLVKIDFSPLDDINTTGDV